jgi:hypothetical protein
MPGASALWLWPFFHSAQHLLGQRVHAARHALVWVSRQTGIPAVVLLAIAIAAAWRLGRRSARFAVEAFVILLVLLALTRIGLLKF